MLVTAANVRAFVTCSDCGKPRCLFAAKKLGKEEAETLDKPKKMLTSIAVEAFSHQTTHWQARSERGSTPAAALTSPATTSPASERPLVFFKCGSASPLPVAEEVSWKFQSAHPVCQECFAKGVHVRTRGQKQMRT